MMSALRNNKIAYKNIGLQYVHVWLTNFTFNQDKLNYNEKKKKTKNTKI